MSCSCQLPRWEPESEREIDDSDPLDQEDSALSELTEVGDDADTPEPPDLEQGTGPNKRDKLTSLRRSVERLNKVCTKVKQTHAWLKTELRLNNKPRPS